MHEENQKNKTKVSVIVPVYNVKKYLARCMESILSQTLEEIEIILIDDCSTDGSIKMVKEYEKEYEKVIGVYLLENHCLGGARNAGLKAAKGDYVTFVDSDDWISPDMCKELYEKAIEEDSDIVYGQYQFVDEQNRVLGIRSLCFPEQLSVSDKNLFKALLILNPHFAWGKIIRRNIFLDNDLYFPEHIFFEDISIGPITNLYAKKISLVEKPFYNYFQRQESISHGPTAKKIEDEIKSSLMFWNECQKRKFTEELKDAIILKFFVSINYFPMQHLKSLTMEEQNTLKEIIFSKTDNILCDLKKIPYLEIYTEHQTYMQISGDSSFGVKTSIERKFADFLKTLQNVAVWGAGRKGMEFAKKYAAYISIKYFIDKKESLWGTLAETGQEIINLYDHVKEIDTIIIVNKNFYYDIDMELKKNNIQKRIINYEIEVMTL